VARRGSSRPQSHPAVGSQRVGSSSSLDREAAVRSIPDSRCRVQSPQVCFGHHAIRKEPGMARRDDPDPLAEATVYMAYGRYEQAAEVLEEGIRAEPTRTDLQDLLSSIRGKRNSAPFANFSWVSTLVFFGVTLLATFGMWSAESMVGWLLLLLGTSLTLPAQYRRLVGAAAAAAVLAYGLYAFGGAESRMKALCPEIAPGTSFVALQEFAARHGLTPPRVQSGGTFLAETRSFGRWACLVTLEDGVVKKSEYDFAD
jgi:hypothetical protein